MNMYTIPLLITCIALFGVAMYYMLRLRAAKEKLVRLAELLAPAGDMYERMGRMVGEIIEEASGERPKSLVVLQHHYVAMAGMYRKELDSFHADMAMDIAQAIEEYNKW